MRNSWTRGWPVVAGILVVACGSGGPNQVLDETVSSISVNPAAGVIADGQAEVTVTVTLRDHSGAPMPGVSVELTASGAQSVLLSSGVTDDHGVLTGTLTTTHAGPQQISALANLVTGPTPLYHQAQVSFRPGPAVGLAFTASPASTQAGAILGPVEVGIVDAHGNPVAVDGDPVTLALESDPSLLTGTTTQPLVAGVARFADLGIVRAGHGYALTATSGTLPAAKSAAFDVVAGLPAVATSHIGFSTGFFGTANGTTPLEVTIDLKDGYGNACAGLPITVSVTGSENTLSPGPTFSSDAQGHAAVQLTSTRAEQKRFTVTSRGMVTTLDGQLGAGNLDLAHSSLTTSATTVIADGTSSAKISLSLRDAHDNPIPYGGNTVGVTTARGTTTVYLSADVGGATSAPLTSTIAGVETVSMYGWPADRAVTVTFVPGPVAQTLLAGVPRVAYVGAPIGAFTAALADAHGNVVTDASPRTVTVSLGTNPTGAVLSGTFTRTTASGVATFDDLRIDRAGAGVRLQATAGTAIGSSGPLDINAWKPLGPAGGDVRALTFVAAIQGGTDPATVYAGTEGAGIFKSTDLGASWAVVDTGLGQLTVRALTLLRDPYNTNGTIVLAGTASGGIFRSVNSGASWAAANAGLGNLRVRALTQGGLYYPDLVLATTAGGAFVSRDRGVSWTAANNGLTDLDLQSATIAGTVFFVGSTSGQIYKSTDTAASWTPVGSSLGASITALTWGGSIGSSGPYYAATAGAGLYKSDTGATWSRLTNGLSSNEITAAISCGYNIVCLATADGDVLRSTDQGNTWGPIDAGLPGTAVGALVSSYAGYGTDTSKLVIGTGLGIFTSTDTGSSWAAGNTGLQNLAGTHIALDPTDPSIVWASAATGISLSTDHGATWRGTGGTLRVAMVAIDPGDPRIVYAASSQGVFKTTDRGGSWAPANNGLTSLDLVAIGCDPGSPSTVYAASSTGGVFKSTDAAAGWTAVNTGLSSLSISALAINPATSEIYAGTADAGAFSTTDGGAHWTAISAGLTSSHVSALTVAGSRLWLGTTDAGLFRSINDGGSWTSAGTVSAPIRAIAVDPATTGRLYLGTSTGVLRSDDTGATWQAINTGLIDLEIVSVAVDPSAANAVYAMSAHAGLAWTASGGR